MRLTVIAAALFAASVNVAAQAKPAPQTVTVKPQAPAAKPPATSATNVTAPPDYVIGPSDVLSINYRNEKDMTGDYIVRPDGKITLPLLNDVDVLGLTPEQLKDRLLPPSAKLLVDPTITVGIKAINSRKVYISGGINKPGPYDLLGPMTVVQLISSAGGLREFADGKVTIIRIEGGKEQVFRFNYKEVLDGKNLKQNILLKSGDTVLVKE